MSISGYLIQRKMRQELTILQHSNCLAITQKQMTNSNQLDFHEPTLQQVADLCSQFGFTCAGEADLACLRAVLREGFSRWGHQPAPPAEVDCPACEGVPKPGNQPCAVCGRSAPPAEGEVAELVTWLRNMAEAGLGGLDELNASRAADLLERRHLAPVPVLPEGTQVIEPTERTILVPVPVPMPVSERLPGLEECDGEGRCWFLRFPFDYSRESWSLEDRTYGCNAGFTHWLPHHALPVPTTRKEENLE